MGSMDDRRIIVWGIFFITAALMGNNADPSWGNRIVHCGFAMIGA